MQILAKSSEEGVEEGLGWIEGTVKKLDASLISYATKLPHMGWNDLELQAVSPLLNGLSQHPPFYFLHSYYFECQHAENILASAEYGKRFAAIVRRENIFGIQCHPEKSHDSGIVILKNFAEM